MKNNLEEIAIRIVEFTKQQDLITEPTELIILDTVSDELLSEMGEIEQYDNVKRALVNMFQVGYIMGKSIK